MTKHFPIELRVVVPRGLKHGVVPAYLHAVAFFTARGQDVYVQEKLLKLSSALPAVIEGTIAYAVLDEFISACPYIDRIVVLSEGHAMASEAAA